MKKFKSVILTSIIIAFVLLVVSFWVPEFEYALLSYLILAGCFLIWVQKEDKASKFLGKLAIGSGLFALLTWFLIFLRGYIFSRFIYDAPLPFKELWDTDYLVVGVVFMFVSFVGGLIGIVFKGFYGLYKSKLDKIIILVGPLAVLFSSLAVYKIKLGGTIMSAMHGWPYPFWTHQIKDIVDGFAIDKWSFLPGSLYHYPIFNYIFYLAIFVFAYFLIKLFNQKTNTRKINSTFFLFGLLVLMILLFTSFLTIKKSYIQYQITGAKDCGKNHSECAIVGNVSPFSCAIVTNKDSADKISKLVNSYPSTGELNCSGKEKAICMQNKCRVSIDHTSNETYWDMLKEAVKDCRVVSIMQAHSLEVRAVLKNDTIINAMEPKIDDIVDIVRQNTDKCGKIKMIIE